MENHPIPQDITGFQFKLIGSMTVKQFIYLAGGIMLGYFTFVSGFFLLIRLPLSLLFFAGGAALAFLPVEGRPMDIMLTNLVRAFFAPTEYVYQKVGGTLEIEGFKRARVAVRTVSPTNSFGLVHPQIEEAENTFAQNVQTAFVTPMAQPLIKPVSQPVVHIPTEGPKVIPLTPMGPQKADMAEKVEPEKIEEPEKKEVKEEKKAKTEEKSELHLERPEVKEFSKEAPAPVTQLQGATVKQVSSSMAKSIGIPMTPEVPNLVTGIIRDPRGNPLPNILVEIKDAEENPVRAFKTNGLGHFASATPLPEGAYTVDFEDPRLENKFQRVSFEAKGEIIPPFEIVSVDKREELRRELFN